MAQQFVDIPTLHPDQVRAWEVPGKYKAVRCGRRWGKTDLSVTVAADAIIKGKTIGWFAPEYRYLSEPFTKLRAILEPISVRSSEGHGIIRTTTGGGLDTWTLDNPNAGRGRRYHGVIIDEAAFAKKNVNDLWRMNIRPTLLDFAGWAMVLSNTNGIEEDNFFWRICNPDQHTHKGFMGFTDFHAPSMNNPYLPPEELEALKGEMHPLVYQQEILAEFVDFSGVSFFSRDKLLVDGRPVPYPTICDCVFATIDTATKTGREHDGTGVVFWAYSERDYGPSASIPLVILDWDIKSIEGALLETWIPWVFTYLEELAGKCRARRGSIGAFVEDKSSGTILLQQARRRDMPVHEIDSKLTMLGKAERAINVSGYVHTEKVKLSSTAYDRQCVYHESHRNHLLAQVTSFRVDDKDTTREDDLLDGFCYGIALSLGNVEGF
jgi:hypothetical protein